MNESVLLVWMDGKDRLHCEYMRSFSRAVARIIARHQNDRATIVYRRRIYVPSLPWKPGNDMCFGSPPRTLQDLVNWFKLPE